MTMTFNVIGNLIFTRQKVDGNIKIINVKDVYIY